MHRFRAPVAATPWPEEVGAAGLSAAPSTSALLEQTLANTNQESPRGDFEFKGRVAVFRAAAFSDLDSDAETLHKTQHLEPLSQRGIAVVGNAVAKVGFGHPAERAAGAVDLDAILVPEPINRRVAFVRAVQNGIAQELLNRLERVVRASFFINMPGNFGCHPDIDAGQVVEQRQEARHRAVELLLI